MKDFKKIIGAHPKAPHPCGIHLSASDTESTHLVPHRMLDEVVPGSDALAASMTNWIVNHHVSPEAIERDKLRREALARQGFSDPTVRFPQSDKTRKGNWAEILLAEYVAASCDTSIPVYRLRYNPNVDQSMKGDDVLAFDLDSDPVRILVGEAKFRTTPTKKVVLELVESLVRSHSGNIPASLQFVADRLFESGNNTLGEKVASCNSLFAQGKLRLDYVGLIASGTKTHSYVTTHAQTSVNQLAVVSLAIHDPAATVTRTFEDARLLL